MRLLEMRRIATRPEAISTQPVSRSPIHDATRHHANAITIDVMPTATAANAIAIRHHGLLDVMAERYRQRRERGKAVRPVVVLARHARESSH